MDYKSKETREEGAKIAYGPVRERVLDLDDDRVVYDKATKLSDLSEIYGAIAELNRTLGEIDSDISMINNRMLNISIDGDAEAAGRNESKGFIADTLTNLRRAQEVAYRVKNKTSVLTTVMN